MRTISIAERRARLARRHRLGQGGRASAPTVESVVEDLVVLHATDPATVYLSVAARARTVSAVDVGDALYERRTIHRTLAMRRTLWVATTETLATVEASSSVDVARRERQRLLGYLADSHITDPESWLDGAYAEVLDALADGGQPARTITTLVPQLGTKLVYGAGTASAVEVGATSRVLAQMAMEGLLARGRPAGDWTGRQYRWHRRDAWMREPSPRPAPDPDRAAADLVRRWLAAFGPATLGDLRWWTGWTLAKVRKALAANPVEEVDLGGATGLVLADDQGPVGYVSPWVVLLPSLDPTTMGWKNRSWYLGHHGAELFDRNGNAGPTVWVDGRIVGGWAQHPDGDIVTSMLEDVGADHRELIDAAAARLRSFIGEVRIRPSFRTPLEKRLAGR